MSMFYLFTHLIATRPVKIYIVYSITYYFKTWVKHYKCYTLNHFLTTQQKIFKFPQKFSVYFLLSLLSKWKLVIYQGFLLFHFFLAFPSYPWMPFYQLFLLPLHLKSFPPTSLPLNLQSCPIAPITKLRSAQTLKLPIVTFFLH